MSADARRDSIVRILEERDRVSVTELMEQFNLTDTSIRHDLVLLEGAGRLRRVRGGAVSRSSRGYAPTLARAREKLTEKRRIGRIAGSLVRAGDVVLFDSGSTVAQVAAQIPVALRSAHAITVVTHSLPVIEEVGTWDQPHLICLGGMYLPEHQALVGPVTLGDLRELTADIAFLGCDGLTIEAGLTTPHMLVAEVGSAMATRARRVVAVADASKLGRAGFTPIVAVDEVDVLVTDEGADPTLVLELRQRGIDVRLA
jgi:DeoR/GlpR family transcriptional regulator of sugar metabolism